MKKDYFLIALFFWLFFYAAQHQRVSSLPTKNFCFLQSAKSSSISNSGKRQLLHSTGYYLPGVEVHYEWDTILNNWKVPYDSVVNIYYTNWPNEGKLKEKIHHSYNNSSNSWDPQNKNVNNYGSNGLLLSTRYYGYSFSNWAPFFRDTFKYNANNKIIEKLSEGWDPNTNSWNVSSKQTFTYHPSNHKLTDEEFFLLDPNTNNLKPHSKTTYSYNALLQPTLELMQDWDETTNTYTNNMQSHYKYANDGKLDKVFTFTYNVSTNNWDSSWRIVNITWYKWISPDINEDQNLISNVEWEMRISNGVYQKFMKQTTTYDPIDDEILTEDYFSWNNGWIKVNGSISMTYTRNPSLNNMITQSIEKDWFKHLSSYRNDYKIIYKDPQFMTSVKNYSSPDESCIVYPNPASDKIYVYLPVLSFNEYFQASLYDLQGKMIFTQKIKNNDVLDISRLEKNAYILHVSNPSGMSLRKIFLKD